MLAFNEALSLMIVGMITVFFILIVLIGELMIKLSNKYIPEQIAEKAGKSNAPKNVPAIIDAAIHMASSGKAKVTNIKKI
jgi:Na+-transporting methylmalonyl-CoA/oxaloacetate decarboxylase gamma subunit